jgi:hypothetical protein
MLMVRLLMPMKDVLVDQESGVLMKLGEQLPLMMILSIRSSTVVILANQRVDDGNPDVGGSCVIHNSSLDILYSQKRSKKRFSGVDFQMIRTFFHISSRIIP